MSSCLYCFSSCFAWLKGYKRARNGLYEPLLQETEREAVAELLQYLERRDEVDFFQGDPLRSLCTLAYSNNIDLQRSAALAFAEITEKDVRQATREAFEPILYLLQSSDVEVQRASAAALGNLAVNTSNKLLIVQMGGLEPLVHLMQSPNVEVQCNVVGCITNLATKDENKVRIARSGALTQLVRLARSRDIRVQRNATGAILNMTHTIENRQQLVNAAAIPVLVNLLNSNDVDVQYYCTTALSNIAVDASNRQRLQMEKGLIPYLINLMQCNLPKIQCQAVLALRNLASDENFQYDIVHAGGHKPLLPLLSSTIPQLVVAAVACVRNLSIHSSNETPIVEAGFLPSLTTLLSNPNEEIACHAISTIRNLAASESNKKEIEKAGAVIKILELLRVAVDDMEKHGNPEKTCSFAVQSEMTACLAVLALSDDLKSKVKPGLDILLRLTSSPSLEVQGNTAAVIGNMASRLDIIGVDFFRVNWKFIQKYLVLLLSTSDATLQHIAVWTLMQLAEGHAKLKELIRADPTLMDLLNKLFNTVTTPIKKTTYHQNASDSSLKDEDADEIGPILNSLLATLR